MQTDSWLTTPTWSGAYNIIGYPSAEIEDYTIGLKINNIFKVWSIVSKKELVLQAVRRINTREKKHFKAWEEATNPNPNPNPNPNILRRNTQTGGDIDFFIGYQ